MFNAVWNLKGLDTSTDTKELSTVNTLDQALRSQDYFTYGLNEAGKRLAAHPERVKKGEEDLARGIAWVFRRDLYVLGEGSILALEKRVGKNRFSYFNLVSHAVEHRTNRFSEHVVDRYHKKPDGEVPGCFWESYVVKGNLEVLKKYTEKYSSPSSFRNIDLGYLLREVVRCPGGEECVQWMVSRSVEVERKSRFDDMVFEGDVCGIKRFKQSFEGVNYFDGTAVKTCLSGKSPEMAELVVKEYMSSGLTLSKSDTERLMSRFRDVFERVAPNFYDLTDMEE